MHLSFWMPTLDESIDQYVVFSFSFSTAPAVFKVVVVHLLKDVLSAAKNYFFRKATLEVQKFVDPKKYTNISVLKDGILFFYISYIGHSEDRWSIQFY